MHRLDDGQRKKLERIRKALALQIEEAARDGHDMLAHLLEMARIEVSAILNDASRAKH
ncbi:hypothetical protein ACFWXH_28880 [Mesorhizobium sp. NPDC059054]|uniref:hypothetical protein n=1 Tax=unclassified Mesorhizobium TaxID=325217 RepID=UPI000ACDF090|nr:hypothetical protein [Mesorhizobium sp. 1M-11]